MSGLLRGLRSTFRRMGAHPLFVRSRHLELMHRATGFATLALVTLAPLLIVVAAADPLGRGGFATWLADGMGLSGRSSVAVTKIVTPPRAVIDTTSVWSGVALAVFGVALGAGVQNGYERIWDLTPGPWHRIWRQAVWLVVLTAYLYQEVLSRRALTGATRTVLSFLTGLLFFWWSQHFLLGGQVRRRRLLLGGIATMIGLIGLRGFSWLVFQPLIVDNAVSYGAVGVVLVIESWLIGVGFVVFGGSLFGRWANERFLRWADDT